MKHECPHCRYTIKFDSEFTGRLAQCDACGNTVQLPSLEGVGKARSERLEAVLARCVWGVAMFAIVILAFRGLGRIWAAESAPQQCAAAAISAFWVLVVYTSARALAGTAAPGGR